MEKKNKFNDTDAELFFINYAIIKIIISNNLNK